MSRDKFIWDEEPIVEKEIIKEDYEKIFGNKKEIEEVEDIDISDKSVDIIENKKHSNKKIIISIIFFILFLIIIPLFRVEKIVINELNFIKHEEILNKIKVEKNKSYSILRLASLGIFYKNDFVGKSSFKYNFKDKSINISIDDLS